MTTKTFTLAAPAMFLGLIFAVPVMSETAQTGFVPPPPGPYQSRVQPQARVLEQRKNMAQRPAMPTPPPVPAWV